MKKKYGSNARMLHLANHKHHNLFQDHLLIGGFYNWHKVFHYPNNFVCWDIHTPKKIMEEKPDFILVGLSRPEMLSFLSEDIENALRSGVNLVNDPMQIGRRPFGKTVYHPSHDNIAKSGVSPLENTMNQLSNLEKVMDVKSLKIFHIDYAVQMWKEVDVFAPGFMRKVLESADYLFTADDAIGNAMYTLLAGSRDIYLIPHPTNVFAIKEITRDIKEKDQIIRCLVHRYDNEWYVPFLANFPLRLCNDAYKMIMVLFDGNPQFGTHIKSLGADHVEYGVRHSQWIRERLAKTYACLDSYHWFNNYGRSVVECAASRTPIVGCDCTVLQPILFPELTTNRGCIHEQAELLLKLMYDKPLYKKCQEYAYNKVDDYGYDNSRQKFLQMVNGEMEPKWKKGMYDKYCHPSIVSIIPEDRDKLIGVKNAVKQ
jgi:hypothetical protein